MRKQRRKLRLFIAYGFFLLCSTTLILAVYAGLHWWLVTHTTVISPVTGTKEKHISREILQSKKEVVMMGLQNAHIVYQNVTVTTDNSVTISLQNNETVILSLNKNIDQQIASLQLTIANLTIEGKQFKRLDFRFDKPVLTL
ncbi:MAG TPA: hypothetical protein VGT05_05155 [Patescibacteria group bacterium]|nr:hypothetical protein [Patescibacteria group bacterium]